MTVVLAKLGPRILLEDHLPFVAKQDMSQTRFLGFCRDTLVKTWCCGSHPCGSIVDRHSSVNSGARYA